MVFPALCATAYAIALLLDAVWLRAVRANLDRLRRRTAKRALPNWFEMAWIHGTIAIVPACAAVSGSSGLPPPVLAFGGLFLAQAAWAAITNRRRERLACSFGRPPQNTPKSTLFFILGRSLVHFQFAGFALALVYAGHGLASYGHALALIIVTGAFVAALPLAAKPMFRVRMGDAHDFEESPLRAELESIARAGEVAAFRPRIRALEFMDKSLFADAIAEAESAVQVFKAGFAASSPVFSTELFRVLEPPTVSAAFAELIVVSLGRHPSTSTIWRRLLAVASISLQVVLLLLVLGTWIIATPSFGPWFVAVGVILPAAYGAGMIAWILVRFRRLRTRRHVTRLAVWRAWRDAEPPSHRSLEEFVCHVLYFSCLSQSQRDWPLAIGLLAVDQEYRKLLAAELGECEVDDFLARIAESPQIYRALAGNP